MEKQHAADVRRKEPESEKITINLGFVDLGHVDLLVREGFYSNRTDFIRTAIRNQLGAHGEVLKQGAARRSMVLGCSVTPARTSRACGRPDSSFTSTCSALRRSTTT